ncbi:MAG: hypothetical protein BV456_09685 [Thermoplasmata archaeon M8B2D]|nr:MAG: hypothetical protein BV456_09685 [Thermoplasmata archaeon M8B2D]
MNKKIIGIFVLLLTTCFLTNIGSETYITNYFVEAKGCSYAPYSDNTIRLTSRIGSLEPIDLQDLSLKPGIITYLPEYFNWMDYEGQDWTTSVKDQGSCGSCWDFAALGALESIIQIREGCANLDLDLSEQYVLSCLPYAGSCNGGLAYRAYKAIESNKTYGNLFNGIIPEFIFPYEVNDEVSCDDARFDWKDFLIPISKYGLWYPDGGIEDRNEIKTQIMESGPVVASMLFTIWEHGSENVEEWGYTHNKSTDYYPYPGPVQGTNHQVVIVGWKDDATIPNGGYWIVKNSLSEEWGYNGFFNIEYGSLNIDSSAITWVDYNQEDYRNWAPVAQINGSTQGHTNQELTFDGSNSFDHEGRIVKYGWDLGDGTSETGVTINHTYAQPGIYRVILFVTDNVTNAGHQSKWVYIDQENQPPQKPTLTGRRIGNNGTSYRYTFFTIDPDGDDLEYYLNWGDDYWFGGAAGWLGPYGSGEEIILEKTFMEKGNYTIRVKARDTHGAESEWTTLEATMSKTNVYTSIMQQLMKILQRFPFFEKILNL